MKNRFIKLFVIAICIGSLLPLCSCERSEYSMERDAKEEAIYKRGYTAGYEEGKWEGMEEAQENFQYTAENIARDADELFELDPEKAIMILGHYADGEPISQEEVEKAIWTIYQYYYDMQEAINDLDSYIE